MLLAGYVYFMSKQRISEAGSKRLLWNRSDQRIDSQGTIKKAGKFPSDLEISEALR